MLGEGDGRRICLLGEGVGRGMASSTTINRNNINAFGMEGRWFNKRNVQLFIFMR